MSEFDELVASPGIIMAGRFGADGRVAQHKATGMYVENPALTGILQWFCAAVTAMFGSMAFAVDSLNPSDPNPMSWVPVRTGTWLPVRSWTYSGGDYVIAMIGDRFLIGERAKLGSLDDLSQLLHAGEP